MLRYCTNCKEDFDFKPIAVSGKDVLKCPKCGNTIDKNSRHPSSIDTNKTEEGIGNVIAGIWNIAYMFYITLAIIGIIGFFLSEKLLFAMATIAVIAFIIQLITGTTAFTEGVVFLPVGAAIGYFVIGDIKGACLGILIVFLIRHIIRDILWNLLFKFIEFINK